MSKSRERAGSYGLAAVGVLFSIYLLAPYVFFAPYFWLWPQRNAPAWAQELVMVIGMPIDVLDRKCPPYHRMVGTQGRLLKAIGLLPAALAISDY